MTIQGTVVDTNTGKALPMAMVTVVNMAGVPTAITTGTGPDGTFRLTSPGIDGNLIVVSYTGYVSNIYDPSTLTSIIPGIIGLSPAAAGSDSTIYNACNPVPLENASPWKMILVLSLLAAAIALAAGGRKKKKMNGPEQYVVPIGMVVLGYFVVTAILNKLGLGGPGVIDKSKTAADQSALDTQKAAGDDPAVALVSNRNMSDNSLQSIATQLTDSTQDATGYDWPTVAKMLAYFAQYRKADAIKFLSVFGKTNGVTLYQWWRDKINNAEIFPTWLYLGGDSFADYAKLYPNNWTTMGVDVNNTDLDIQGLIRQAVGYVYTVAGAAMT